MREASYLVFEEKHRALTGPLKTIWTAPIWVEENKLVRKKLLKIFKSLKTDIPYA
jgi:hypothetical protein